MDEATLAALAKLVPLASSPIGLVILWGVFSVRAQLRGIAATLKDHGERIAALESERPRRSRRPRPPIALPASEAL